MAETKKKKETEEGKETAPSTAIELAKAQNLLPEDVVFDELIDNFKEMDEIEFPRIRFRQGKFFFSDDPADKGVTEFQGVILFYGRQNTYWEGTFDSNNIVPPECFSVDGVSGSKARDSEGRFGTCDDCALNKFKSGNNGKGKACRNQMKLYIQVVGSTVPSTLFLAPTSIGNFTKNYIMNRVTQKGLNYFRVVTNFKAFQMDRETFYRINFEVDGVYKGEDAVTVKKLRDFWMDAIKRDRARLDASVTSGGGGDEDGPKAQASRKAETPANTRTVTPRQTPAPAAAAKAVVAEDSAADNSDDDEPPF